MNLSSLKTCIVGAGAIGGFLGAWLGGLAITRFGNYNWMWWADIALALMAAVEIGRASCRERVSSPV